MMRSVVLRILAAIGSPKDLGLNTLHLRQGWPFAPKFAFRSYFALGIRVRISRNRLRYEATFRGPDFAGTSDIRTASG